MTVEKITLLQLLSQIVKRKVRACRNILVLNWTAHVLISLCIFPGYLVRKRFGNCLHHVECKEEELNYLYVSAWMCEEGNIAPIRFRGTFYGNILKNTPEKGSFAGRTYFHCIPLNVEVLAVFQCDCTVPTAPENNTGFWGETGTKIFMCFLGWYINI